MTPEDITRLRELCLLLDLAYEHWFNATGESRGLKSAEGTVRLEFGNVWYRQNNPNQPPAGPQIESVVVYSSVFSAARVSYFDTLDDAINVVQGWYQIAKDRASQAQG